MKRIYLVAVVLVAASLACGQYITPTPTTAAEAVTTPDNTPSPVPSPTVTLTAESVNTVELIYTAVVVQATVNVRQEPDGAVIGAVSSGDTVTVIECRDNWCEIETDVLTGYVFRGCLSGQEDLGCTAK